jgi:hypothetical protein
MKNLSIENLDSSITNVRKINLLTNNIQTLESTIATTTVKYNPPYSAKFASIANHLGFNSKELEILFTDIFNDPSQYEIDLLKQLCIYAKLRHSEATNAYQNELKKSHDNFEKSTYNYKKMQETLQTRKNELEELMQESALVNFNKIWTELIDDYYENSKTYDFKVDLYDFKTLKFHELMVRNSRFVNNITNNIGETIADVDWNKIKNDFHHDHKRNIMKQWSEKLSSLENDII